MGMNKVDELIESIKHEIEKAKLGLDANMCLETIDILIEEWEEERATEN